MQEYLLPLRCTSDNIVVLTVCGLPYLCHYLRCTFLPPSLSPFLLPASSVDLPSPSSLSSSLSLPLSLLPSPTPFPSSLSLSPSLLPSTSLSFLLSLLPSPSLYLPRPAYWSVTLELNACVVPSSYEAVNISSCTLFFSVCKALPAAQCGGVANSSTCQLVMTRDSKKHYYSIGDYHGNSGYEATGELHLYMYVHTIYM